MDIKQLNSGLYSSRANDNSAVRSPKENGEGKGVGQAGLNSDKVTLTQNLTQIADLETKTRNVNIDNSERIAALKASIADGSYQVDSKKVADKLLQSEHLFAKI